MTLLTQDFKHMLSVIVPIYNEEKYIAKCLDSILEQDYPKEEMELLLVDGMSNDATRDIVREYTNRNPHIRMIDNPKRNTPCAMNLGIKEANGDIIIRLDAHVLFPSNYFSELVNHLHSLDADNVGAVCRTLPANDSIIAQSIAAVLSSKFGMGNSYFRVGTPDIRSVDTVPFGCFKREIFDKIGLFDEELIRNQDDELNGRIIKNGGKIYLLPYLYVDYFARDTISKTFRMFYQYGLFKPLVNKKLGTPTTVRQFFPLVFVLGIILGPFAGLIHTGAFYCYFVILLLYAILSLIFSFKASHNIIRIVTQCWVFFVVHFAYGWGYIVGIFKVLTSKKITSTSNR